MATRTSLQSEASQDLIRLARACSNGEAGAEAALATRVSQVVENRELAPTQNPEQQSMSLGWKVLCAGGAAITGLFVYALGASHGSNDILSRLPEEQAGAIRKDIEAENLKKLLDAWSYAN